MNITALEFALSQKITAGASNLDLLAYARAIQQLRTGTMFTAATTTDLPAAASNGGKLYLVESLQLVVFSNGVRWQSIVPKLGQISGWGMNSSGQLGDGTAIDRSSPVRESSSSGTWCQVSTGFDHTGGIKTNNTLWTWGLNSSGQLGTNSTVSTSAPVREISSSTNWCSVSLGGAHTAALKGDLTLWTWGGNTCGQLGNSTVVSRSSPIREISSSSNWCAVSAECLTTGAIKTLGTLWMWGRNNCGALGDGTTTDRSSPVQEANKSTAWCQLGTGVFHTAALKTDGSLWSWGRNPALGNNASASQSSPVREITSSSTWCTVSAGLYHTAGVKTDGTLWAWGVNTTGQLGDNSTTSRSSPVQEACKSTTWCSVGVGYHSSALKTDGSLWTWGCNSCGQLGNNTTTTSSVPVREITSSSNWSSTAAGKTTTFGITLAT
jgi:alpha-tubulin suppressor-like RCC1 family protein